MAKLIFFTCNDKFIYVRLQGKDTANAAIFIILTPGHSAEHIT